MATQEVSEGTTVGRLCNLEASDRVKTTCLHLPNPFDSSFQNMFVDHMKPERILQGVVEPLLLHPKLRKVLLPLSGQGGFSSDTLCLENSQLFCRPLGVAQSVLGEGLVAFPLFPRPLPLTLNPAFEDGGHPRVGLRLLAQRLLVERSVHRHVRTPVPLGLSALLDNRC